MIPAAEYFYKINVQPLPNFDYLTNIAAQKVRSGYTNLLKSKLPVQQGSNLALKYHKKVQPIMHNVNSIFFQIHGRAQQCTRNFHYRSKMVPGIADNKHFWTSYHDYFRPSLCRFGEVVDFLEASFSIQYLGGPFLNFGRKNQVWTSWIIKSTTFGSF